MIKFRSFSFYKYSNPSIKNGGFYGDSKMEIYNLLPAGLYPRTALIQKNELTNFEKKSKTIIGYYTNNHIYISSLNLIFDIE